ncbi:MAG: 3'-5' exonuclease, partial [Streptococcus mitis]|nr:3'-5' exonuclease [Streptococcus mitis]
MLGYLFVSLFNILASGLSLFSIVFVAYSYFTVSKQWNKGNNQDLFNLIVISGLFLIIIRIFDLIAKSISEHYTAEHKQIAILTRTNSLAKSIYKMLEKKGIPCIRVEDIRLMRTTEVKDLLAVMSYAINLRNSYALEKIIKHPVIHMEQWLIQELKKTKSGYMYLHDWFLAENNDPYQPLIEGYMQNKIVVLDVEST